jgi:hypothetical protein
MVVELWRMIVEAWKMIAGPWKMQKGIEGRVVAGMTRN